MALGTIVERGAVARLGSSSLVVKATVFELVAVSGPGEKQKSGFWRGADA